jgi:hypothetical protein
MGQSSRPPTWAEWFPAQMAYDPTLGLYAWTGPACPPLGLVIPSSGTWPAIIFPNLPPGPFRSGLADRCGGGLAELELYNPETGRLGPDALGKPDPDVGNGLVVLPSTTSTPWLVWAAAAWALSRVLR